MQKKNKDKNINKMIANAFTIQKTNVHEANSLGFMARSFILATMPHSKPKSNEFTRINGNYTLHMMSPSIIGLPYGAIPRLFLAYLTKQIKQTKSREVSLGNNLNQFMKELGLIPTGGRWGTITNLKLQIRKTLNCDFRVWNNTEKGEKMKKYEISDGYYLMWDKKNSVPKQSSLFASTIHVSEGFYNDVIENSMPLDMRILKALKGSAFTLDVYMFLTYRLAYLKKETVIPYKILFALFGSNYKELKHFKESFKKATQKVCLFVPEFNVTDHKNGLKLEPSKLHIPRKSNCL